MKRKLSMLVGALIWIVAVTHSRATAHAQDGYGSYMQAAERAKAVSNYPLMEQLIQTALNYGAGDEYAWRSLAWAQSRQGKWDISLAIAQENVRRNGVSGWSMAQLAESAIGAEDYALARRALETARQLPVNQINSAKDSLLRQEQALVATIGTRTYKISFEIDLMQHRPAEKPVWLLVPLKNSPQQSFKFTVKNALSWKERHVGIRDYVEIVQRPGLPIVVEGTLDLKPYCLGSRKLHDVSIGECPDELKIHLTKFQNFSWWDPDYPGVREIAKTLRGRTGAVTVQNVLDWFHKNIRYDATIKDDPKLGQLGTILKCRYGGCHHNSGLFVTLCRACGIPACVAHGNVLPENDLPFNFPHAIGHGWAEVYLNGIGWVPVEPTNPNSLRAYSACCSYVAVGPSNRPPENHQFSGWIEFEGEHYRMVSIQGADIHGQRISVRLPDENSQAPGNE